MKDLIKPLDFNNIILTQQEKESSIDYRMVRITEKVKQLEQNHREAIKWILEVVLDYKEDENTYMFEIKLLEKLTGQKWEDLKNMEV